MIDQNEQSIERFQTVSLSGIIIGDKWDNRGRIVDFALLTYDEKKYTLTFDDSIGDLTQLIRKSVVVTGRVQHESDIIITQVRECSAAPDNTPDNSEK